MFGDNGNGNGNGHDVAEKLKDAVEYAELDIDKIKERGGIFSNRGNTQSQSLLHRVITPAHNNASYRDELKTANFASPDEADEAVAALEECFELGMDPTPIIDQIIARNAGVKYELLRMVTESLTHSTFNINEQRNKTKNGNSGSKSSIS